MPRDLDPVLSLHLGVLGEAFNVPPINTSSTQTSANASIKFTGVPALLGAGHTAVNKTAPNTRQGRRSP